MPTRKITCHECGIMLCEVLPGAKIRKEGFYALCLKCKNQDDKNEQGIEALGSFLNGFRK